MLEDYTNNLEKRHKRTMIALWVLSVVCAVLLCLCLVFFFVGWEAETETITENIDTEYNVEQDSGDGGTNTAIIDSNVNQSNHDSLYNCICICVGIITVGVIVAVVIHGKAKHKD